jgi:ATP-binding cassette, subfamily B, heavy metal transporter
MQNQLKTFLNALQFLWPKDPARRLSFILAFFLMGISIALNVLIPLIYKKVIQIFSSQNKSLFSLVPIILVLYCLLWFIVQVLYQVRSAIMIYALKRGLRVFFLRIFTHLHSLSLRFHMDRRTGLIINALERALTGFENIFFNVLLFMIPTLIEMIIVIILLYFFYGAFYSWGLLFITTSYLFFSLITIGYKTKKRIAFNKTRAATGFYIVDSLINFETVKYFSNAHHDSVLCDNFLKEQEIAGVAAHISEAAVQTCQNLVIGVGLLYMTLITSSAVVHGQMNVSDFVLINGYVLRFVMPLHQLGLILVQMSTGLHDMSDIMHLLEEKPEIKDIHNAISFKTDAIDITFDNVVFGYDQQRTILKGISFTVPAGKRVAIIGASGAGKSTIARLLFRSYDVSSGSILLNGHDIRSITQESLHSLIGVVPQDTVLFNNTLYYNIAYGCPTASEEEIALAIKRAYLDELIKRLPKRDQTIVGERGLKLSGGEKQRVAIARVLLKKPKIYIFDEATSSLDTCTEKEIQRNLEEIATGTTTLIIAHRLSTVVNVNQILVLDQGVIVERGSHQKLLRLNGIYANMWQKQSHNYIKELH